MIWCVEDDASIRDIEVYALQSTGFEAKGFEDGQVFWDALQKESPELVILDVMLPGLDGIELLRRMKSSSAFSADSSPAFFSSVPVSPDGSSSDFSFSENAPLSNPKMSATICGTVSAVESVFIFRNR